MSPIPKVRFHETMSRVPDDGRTLLDEMHTTFLRDLFTGSEHREFRPVMRQILRLKEPLPISALDFTRERFPREDVRHYPIGFILNLMASLLADASEVHASFYDFLLDGKRSEEFLIQQGDIHRDLALASFSVMQGDLHFNICGLEMSYISNSEVADLEKKTFHHI